MLLTDPLSIRYLAGVRDARWALVTPHAAWIMPYALSWAAIRGQAGWPWRVLPPTPGSGGLLGCLRRAGVARLGFVGDTLGWSAAERLRRDVARVCVTSGLEGIVAAVRIVKDAAEREVLARAAAIAAGAGAALPWIIRTGMSEREAASRLDQRMRALGAEGPAFDTIILFGANAALPHGIPGDRRLRRGDLVLVDWGARLDGYHSDMTRVFAAGRPTAAQRAAYRAVWRSYTRARAVVRDGVPAEVPDAAARRALGARAATFMHSLGHGVGLAIHEDPRLGRGMRGRLRTGMVVTVEPGIYLPGWGGIRLEDTVVVTPAGAVSLTGAPAAELPLIATR
jgi:Xaa-Pro aminopeptidase